MRSNFNRSDLSRNRPKQIDNLLGSAFTQILNRQQQIHANVWHSKRSEKYTDNSFQQSTDVQEFLWQIIFPQSLPQLEITIKLYEPLPQEKCVKLAPTSNDSSKHQFFQTNYKQQRWVSVQRHVLNEISMRSTQSWAYHFKSIYANLFFHEYNSTGRKRTNKKKDVSLEVFPTGRCNRFLGQRSLFIELLQIKMKNSS